MNIKSKTKKLISILLAIVILTSCFAVGMVAFAVDLLPIDANNFPDANWRSVVSEYYDENQDGYLSTTERTASTMSISGMLEETCGEDATISDLKGIENFTNLKTLRCGGIDVAKMDISSLTALQSLTCSGNKLTTLDLSKNVNLVTVDCSDNGLKSLNLSNNTKLQTLRCYANNLPSIDVTKSTALKTLRCDQNKLTKLNVTKNTNLESLICSHNCLTSLNLSANTKLGIVTNYMMGSQSASATAINSSTYISIPFTIENYANVVSTSLDTVTHTDDGDTTNLAYDGKQFTTKSSASIIKGVDYRYSVGLDNAENMSVHIDVARDFYQVNFYTSSDKSVLLGSSIVNAGQNAIEPQLPTPPQCKLFDKWSDDITNINEDKDVYIIYKDDHDFHVTAYDNGMVGVTCSKCGKTYITEFKTVINKKVGDPLYDKALDINNDGIINAKDFAKIIKTV